MKKNNKGVISQFNELTVCYSHKIADSSNINWVPTMLQALYMI